MTNLQAAVGCAQLERLNEFVERKKFIRSYYDRFLDGLRGVRFFPVPDWCESSCWFSGFMKPGNSFEESRQIVNMLKDFGVESRTFWKPIHLQAPYAACLKASSLERTMNLWGGIITLPCSTSITDEELETVAKAVIKVLE